MSAPRRLADWPGATICDRDRTIVLGDMAGHADPRAAALKGRHVLIRTVGQLDAAVALVQLDGLASRLVIAPPDLRGDKLAAVAEDAAIEVVVGDAEDVPALGGRAREQLDAECRDRVPVARDRETEWVMLTSGTSGRPKLVRHSLHALCGAIPLPADTPAGASVSEAPVWATFYDIRRYGGLQILLRAVLGGARLLVGSIGEDVTAQLRRFGTQGVSAISGTPSHWRNALIGSAYDQIDPDYVRLSGETADQMTLDALKAAYPRARIAHAYASTEAGVAFAVDDGLAGFPAAFVDDGGASPVALRVIDGVLWIRSPRTALGYLGPDAAALHDAEGFVDTGDLVERRGDRFCFAGRRNGIINVGGLKVSPEEVEAVIDSDPRVARSLVKAKNNPLLGAIVAADVVLREGHDATPELQAELLQFCRDRLERHKAPAMLRFVDDLPLTDAGKLSRAR